MEEVETTNISIFNTIAVLISAFFAVESAWIIGHVSSFVKRLAKTEENPVVLELKQKISTLKKERDAISPTSQFAAYFKKDREIIKLTEDLAKLEATNPSETAKLLKIDGATRVIIQLLAIALLRYVSSITAFCIPSNIFWPLNFLIRFPAFFGNDSCPNEFSEVSGFAIAFLAIHFINLIIKYFRKFANKQKTA